jgi:hypothetical protein
VVSISTWAAKLRDDFLWDALEPIPAFRAFAAALINDIPGRDWWIVLTTSLNAF